MRIAQLAPQIYPVPPIHAGGTERIVYDLTEALVAGGHEVTLIAAEGSRTSARLKASGPAIAGLDGAPPGLPAAREAVALDQVRQARRDFDLVHCHTEFCHAAALDAWGVPTLTTIHWRTDERDRQEFLQHFKELPVAAISGAQREAMPRHHRSAPVVYHGIDTQRYRLGDGAGGYAAFLGRMTDQKGPDRAIRIAAAAGLGTRLAGNLDVGNPDYFIRAVAPLLGSSAEYLGTVTDHEKNRFLGEASVLLFPIDWPEPFGLAVLEAMLCGTPVVATAKGAMPELIEPGVTGFLVTDPSEWTDAISRARALDRAGIRRRAVARFSRERMADDYVEAYRKIIRTRSSLS